MSYIVCDSCVMQRYTECLIGESEDAVRTVIDCVLDHHKPAMDSGGKMQHQWLETCGQFFGELLFSWLRLGKVEIFEESLHEQHKKHLIVQCGFPFNQRHEGVFIAVAAVAFPHILVGDDIDFWEPKHKGCGSAKREEILRLGRGAVAKYLRTKVGVTVVCVEQASHHLCPAEAGRVAQT